MAIIYTVGSYVELVLIRGDAKTFHVTWKPGGVPANLTGYTASLLDSDGDPITASVTIPSPTSGTVVISFLSAQTEIMNDQYYRLRVAQGGNKTTLLEGRLSLI